MKSGKTGTTLRKWSRIIHRDVSFFFAGMMLIYAISGIVMNHRQSFNPNYSVERHSYMLNTAIPSQADISKEDVLKLLEPIGEAENYTKHYFPEEGQMKVFLKGGSNYWLNLKTQEVVYEKLTPRPILSALTKLHYNPGRWWTYFADFFGIALILITITGIIMLKGNKGIWGRGGIELVIGLLIPLLFLYLS